MVILDVSTAVKNTPFGAGKVAKSCITIIPRGIGTNNTQNVPGHRVFGNIAWLPSDLSNGCS